MSVFLIRFVVRVKLSLTRTYQDKARADSDYPPVDQASDRVDDTFIGAGQGCYAIESIYIGVGKGMNDHDAGLL